MSNVDPLLQEDVRKRFAYDPDTGTLTWRERPSNCIKLGDEVGCLRADGYRVVSCNGRLYRDHRLIWFLVHGDWPEVVDHINGDRADNRLVNLRASSKLLNARNCRPHRDAACGLKGVTFRKDVGRFATAEEAHAAYCAASAIYHGEHGRTS